MMRVMRGPVRAMRRPPLVSVRAAAALIVGERPGSPAPELLHVQVEVLGLLAVHAAQPSLATVGSSRRYGRSLAYSSNRCCSSVPSRRPALPPGQPLRRGRMAPCFANLIGAPRHRLVRKWPTNLRLAGRSCLRYLATRVQPTLAMPRSDEIGH